MAIAPQTPSPTKTKHRPLWLFALGIAVVAIVGVALYLQLKPKPTPTTTNTVPAAAVTPGEYTDFYGQIDSIEENIVTINFPVTSMTGQQSTHVYRVIIDDQTDVTQSVQKGDPTPITAATLKVGDMIQIFGSTNLAEVSTFKATRIVLVSSASS